MIVVATLIEEVETDAARNLLVLAIRGGERITGSLKRDLRRGEVETNVDAPLSPETLDTFLGRTDLQLREFRDGIRQRSNRAFALVVLFSAAAAAASLATTFALRDSGAAVLLSAALAATTGTAAAVFFRVYVIETRREDAVVRDLARIEVVRLKHLIDRDLGIRLPSSQRVARINDDGSMPDR